MKFIKRMSLRWGEERIKGFSEPVKKAEDWTWWVLFAAGIAMGILIILKITDKI